jgi:hypothetical protein
MRTNVHKVLVSNIKAWLVDELKHDSYVVNGRSEVDDEVNDIVKGRYEVCRELLHFIRSQQHEPHDNLDEG